MAFRSFVDAAGTTWQVWDIFPLLAERRASERRDEHLGYRRSGANRRHDDRRIVQSRRTVLSGSYAAGWLCFESDGERRRLSPIPDEWRSCPDALLQAHLARATPVRNAKPGTAAFADDVPDAPAVKEIENAG